MSDYVSNVISGLVGAVVAVAPTWLTVRSSARVARDQRLTPSWVETAARMDRLEADNDALWRAIGAVVWPAHGVIAWIDGGAVPPPPHAVSELRDILADVDALRASMTKTREAK